MNHLYWFSNHYVKVTAFMITFVFFIDSSMWKYVSYRYDQLNLFKDFASLRNYRRQLRTHYNEATFSIRFFQFNSSTMMKNILWIIEMIMFFFHKGDRLHFYLLCSWIYKFERFVPSFGCDQRGESVPWICFGPDRKFWRRGSKERDTRRDIFRLFHSFSLF